ncbi:MAG: lactate racemase domain-containing protein [Litorilinea sp.]
MIQAPPVTALDRHLVTMPSRAWYGDIDLTLEFPAEWDVHTLAMHDAPTLDADAIAAAFANPIGTPPISELAKGRTSATIVVDDVSRPTPASVLVPYVLQELAKAGVPKSEIRFVVGGGSHRPQTKEEFEKKLGADIVRDYAVKSHNFMAGDLKGIGALEDGTPLYFDPWVADADFKMTIGGIYPHGAVGFGGGSKLILPGVAGFATIFSFHTHYPARGQGNIERSGDVPDHRDASEAAARALGLDLVVNMVINSRREVAAVFVGDFVQAQRAGARFARTAYGTHIPDTLRDAADLVVVNAYPLDSDPIQTGKALWCRSHFAKARFVAVNPAVDGICYHGLYDRVDWTRYSAQLAAREVIPDPEAQLAERDQAIIWSENYPAADFPRKQPKDLLVRKWDTVIDLLKPALPARATVAVFPSSGLQLLARE